MLHDRRDLPKDEINYRVIIAIWPNFAVVHKFNNRLGLRGLQSESKSSCKSDPYEATYLEQFYNVEAAGANANRGIRRLRTSRRSNLQAHNGPNWRAACPLHEGDAHPLPSHGAYGELGLM